MVFWKLWRFVYVYTRTSTDKIFLLVIYKVESNFNGFMKNSLIYSKLKRFLSRKKVGEVGVATVNVCSYLLKNIFSTYLGR